jgi:hypothetical protein
VDQKQLQKLEDAYLKRFNAGLPQGLGSAAGNWNWPAYGVTSVSAMVIGYRKHTQMKGGMEVVYLVTISSNLAIPNPGKALREGGPDRNWYTFVQLGGSATVPLGFQTQLLSTYVGTNPYRRKPPAPKLPGPQGRLAKVPPPGPGPTPPHPPP